MLYLDANFFIFALLDRTDRGVEARRLQQTIVEGKERAITSSLALDEVMWVLIKGKKRHLLRAAIEGIYSTPNLDVVEVSSTAPLLALGFIEKYDLKLRDAFHIAVIRENEMETIISDDEDFDRIEWIKRIKF
ncbi:MAG: tRNA(fMet)-specific endonuclease VapC [Candidatus Bathyarchaeota archaeon BA1]|nr:MAG: tRNA(fMet)-specific endonuclease VapC [Candidatus Bathyarchaeota archaeon BA1]